MLLDGAVMQEVENRTNDRAGFIDTAVGEKKNEVEKQLQDTQAQVAYERASRLALEQRARDVEAARLQQEAMAKEAAEEVKTAKAAAAAAEAKIADAQAMAERVEEEKREKAARSQSEIGDLKDKVDFQEKMVKGLIAALFMLLISAALVVTLALNWVTDGWLLVGVILVGGAFLLAPVAWLLGRKKTGAIIGSIAVALGIVTGVYDLVSADDSNQASKGESSQKASSGSPKSGTDSEQK